MSPFLLGRQLVRLAHEPPDLVIDRDPLRLGQDLVQGLESPPDGDRDRWERAPKAPEPDQLVADGPYLLAAVLRLEDTKGLLAQRLDLGDPQIVQDGEDDLPVVLEADEAHLDHRDRAQEGHRPITPRTCRRSIGTPRREGRGSGP